MCGGDGPRVKKLDGVRTDQLAGGQFEGTGVPGVLNVQVEAFGDWTYAGLKYYMNIHPNADIAPEHSSKWQEIGRNIGSAKADFRSAVTGALRGPAAAKGDTADAVWANLTSSLNVPDSIATDAARMSIIVEAFSKCISQTRQQLAEWEDEYSKVTDPDDREQYNKFARGLMADVYAPGIENVASNHPDVARDAPPNISPVNVPGGPAGGPSVGGPSVGGPSVGGPSVKTPSIPTAKDLQQVTKSANPSTDPSKSLGDAAKGVSDAANSAGGAANDAAGKASDALNQALGSLGSLGSQTPDGLNPDKLSGLGGVPIGGLHPTGTPRGTGGGPSGAGAGSTLPKTAANPALAASPTKATAAAPVSRAGISTQGSPGAAGGAPAAGTRQGGAAGTVHKVNKALNNRKNGSEIVAQADAVVAVVGEEAKPEQTTKPVPS